MHVLGRDFQVSAPSPSFKSILPWQRKWWSTSWLICRQRHPRSWMSIVAPVCSALSWPRSASRLIGIESSQAACDDFSANLEEFDNVELYEDAAENVLPALDVQAEVVLVVPRRRRAGACGAGWHPAHRAADRPLRLVRPVHAGARMRARLLNGGYSLRSSTPFDLFPQTYHIESISWFRAIALTGGRPQIQAARAL